MPVIVARFGKPEDVTDPGFDGKAFRFPLVVIDREDVGTPRQLSKTKSLQIRVEVSDSRISTWNLAQTDLIKVLFEIAKKHLTSTLASSAWTGGDLGVRVDTDTYAGPCPFDPALIQDPGNAVLEIEIRRPIGFT